VKLRDPAHAAAAAAVDRNLSLDRELEIPARPDDSRVDRSRGAARAAIEPGRQGDLDHRDHAVERLAQPHVFHERLQVDEAVLEREAPLEEVRMLIDAPLAVLVDARAAGARRDADSELAGDREWPQELRIFRQVAEALAEENRRREGAERLAADSFRA